jgi:hypothetical protein
LCDGWFCSTSLMIVVFPSLWLSDTGESVGAMPGLYGPASAPADSYPHLRDTRSG